MSTNPNPPEPPSAPPHRQPIPDTPGDDEDAPAAHCVWCGAEYPPPEHECPRR